MTREDVLRLIGPPSDSAKFPRLDQVSWEYYFQDAWGYRALFFVKENAGFHASHGLGDFLGNAINELIKVENRIDSLGGPL